ncbi:hypothetical protein DFJ73DRAFT_949277 [Zopfochytrium polystomum]|nr:hypothetical protein DFJ73DRAFT_949277 [Zopfochytrium polystomum]
MRLYPLLAATLAGSLAAVHAFPLAPRAADGANAVAASSSSSSTAPPSSSPAATATSAAPGSSSGSSSSSSSGAGSSAPTTAAVGASVSTNSSSSAAASGASSSASFASSSSSSSSSMASGNSSIIATTVTGSNSTSLNSTTATATSGSSGNSSGAATTTATAGAPSATADAGFVQPTGLVTLLLQHEQASGARGAFLAKVQGEFVARVNGGGGGGGASAASAMASSSSSSPSSSPSSTPAPHASSTNASTTTPTTNSTRASLKVDWRVFPETDTYEGYLSQLRSACDKNVTGLFDVVFVEASRVGEFADCLADFWALDGGAAAAGKTGGVMPAALANGVVDGRLVALPTEIELGLIVYNTGLLDRYGLSGPPTSFDAMADLANSVMSSERAMDNYQLSGITGIFSGELLTTQLIEWLAGRRNTTLLNPTTSQPNMLTLSAAEALAAPASWVDTGLIHPDDLTPVETPDPFKYSPITPPSASTLRDTDLSFSRFVSGRAVFMRHGTRVLPALTEAAADAGVEWDATGVVGLDAGVSVGALGGWTVGVYGMSENKGAAARVAEFLASKAVQRRAVAEAGLFAMPAWTDLYSDREVCAVLGERLCQIAKATTPSLRPSTQVKRHYSALSSIVSSDLFTYLSTPMTVITFLATVDANIRAELFPSSASGNANGTNKGVDDLLNSDPSLGTARTGKAVPTHLGAQLAGLFLVIAVSGVVVLLMRKKAMDELAKKEAAAAAGGGGGEGGAAAAGARAAATAPLVAKAGSSGDGKSGETAGRDRTVVRSASARMDDQPAANGNGAKVARKAKTAKGGYEQLEEDGEDLGPDENAAVVTGSKAHQSGTGAALAAAHASAGAASGDVADGGNMGSADSLLALEMAAVDRSERASFV